MAKQSYGTSTGGVNKSAKGDLPSDRNTMSYGRGPLTDLSSKGNLPIDRDTRAYGPAPRVNPNKGNPPSNLPKPTGVATVTPVKTKNVPRTYASKSMPKSIFSILARGPIKKPVVAAKPVAKKPVVTKPAAVVSNVVREKLSPVQNSSVSKKPPATRFGTVTGKTTGTRVSGGGGYGGGGTRGGGSLSGGGSGTRSAGTSRTGGTQRNDPVRG